MADTIAAIATGRELSAIGIVRLSGPDAIRFADQLFRPVKGKILAERRDRSLAYGELRDRAGKLLDLCLCTISRGPESYTGEDTAEFQCHGSPVLLRLLLQELFALGARQAGPGEFTRRAFLNGRMDLSCAEAVIDLIDAESAEAVTNAAAQLSGTLSRKIGEIYERLTDMSAHFHAVLDYPDEDIEDFEAINYAGMLEESGHILERLLRSAGRGAQMKSGIPAAIIGPPNAGKSSLLNALLGYERAIVTDVPGTTRDTVEEKLILAGRRFRLTDTAGIRETEDRVERLGVERSRNAAERAELVLAVLDGSRKQEQESVEKVLKMAEAAPKALVLLTKADLGEPMWLPETGLKVLRLSSLTGEGLDKLEEALTELFPDEGIPAGEILTNLRQEDAVRRALESLQAAQEALRIGATPDLILTEAEEAMQALGEITGACIREDITDRIFSRFCVGK